MEIPKVSIMAKKVLKKFRSSNVIYDDYSIEVSPFTETGESSRTDLVESGGGKMYVTKGSKKKTRCIHLSVDANDPDPVRKLYKQMDDVLEQAKRDGQELPEYKPKAAPRGTVLEKTPDYTCALNETQGHVEISITIDLAKDVDFCDKLYHNYINISKCLHYNEDSLKKQCKLLAKRSSN